MAFRLPTIFAPIVRRWRLLALACFIGLTSGLIAALDIAGTASRGRDMSLDIYTQIQPFEGDAQLGKQMVLVDIDEATLARYGQWPWPRQYMAVLLQNIGYAEPLTIGLDILMSEQDRFNADAIEVLGDMPAGSLAETIPDGDALLGDMLSMTPSVAAISLSEDGGANPVYSPGSVSIIGSSDLPVLQASYLLSPVEKVARSPGAGFVSLSLNRDSVVRHMPMIAKVGDTYLPSLSLEMLRVAQGARGHVLKQALDTGSVSNKLRTGSVILELDEFARLPIYHGYSDRFTTISAADVLEAKGLEKLTHGFVIIGSSAKGLKDIHSTNLETAIPGAFVHLQAIHQILSGVTLKSSALFDLAEIGAATLAAMIVGCGAALLPLMAALVALVMAGAAVAYGEFYLFTEAQYLSNGVMTTSMVVISGLLTLIFRAFADELARRKLRGAFGQYLSPEMVRQIENSNVSPELGGTTTDISVMFMDVRGFTTLSERLADKPQELTRIINIILDEATHVIMAHGGTLDKYIGDAVMAFWNAPLPQHDHHARAVNAAIALQNHVPEINAKLQTEMGGDWPGYDIAIGVGVASGTAVVGNFGSSQRLSYSVVGDTVNLAARLEPFGKQTGLPVALADNSATGAAHPDVIQINNIAIRGRDEPEPVHSYLPLTPATRALHDELVSALIIGKKPAIKRALKAIADAQDYPASLLDYYKAQC